MPLFIYRLGQIAVALSASASLITACIHVANFILPGHRALAFNGVRWRFYRNPGSLFVAVAWLSVCVTLLWYLLQPSGHVHLARYIDAAYVTLLCATSMLGCVSAALSRAQR
jgi:hypothetical protein